LIENRPENTSRRLVLRPVLLMPVFLAGCLAGLHQSPPGPVPVPVSWQPKAVFRALLETRDPGSTVLDGRDGFSPDEAALFSLDHNPMLRAVRAEKGIARAEILRAGLLPNPKLEGNISVPAGGRDALMLGYGGGLSWNVMPLLPRSSRIQAARERSVSVDLDIAWREWQVAQSARLHAIRLIFLGRQVNVAREAGKYWRKRVKSYQCALAAKATTKLQLAGAQRSLAEWRLQRQEFERQRLIERAALARSLGIEPSQVPAMQASWHPGRDIPDSSGLVAGLGRHRLDLIALQHAQQSRDHALRAAALARFPPIELGIHGGRDVDGVGSAGFTLSFTMPVFDHNQYQTALEHARRHKVKEEYKARLLRAETQTDRYVKELSLLKKQLATAEAADKTANRLAVLADSSASLGVLNPMIAAGSQDAAYRAQLKKLAIEKAYAETTVALSITAGVTIR